MAALVRPARAHVPARGRRAHRGEAWLEDVWPPFRAGGLAERSEDPVRYRSVRLRAAAEGDLVAGAARPARDAPALRPPCTRTRHRGGLRPAAENAAREPQIARDRPRSTAGKSRPRPDGARGGYC